MNIEEFRNKMIDIVAEYNINTVMNSVDDEFLHRIITGEGFTQLKHMTNEELFKEAVELGYSPDDNDINMINDLYGTKPQCIKKNVKYIITNDYSNIIKKSNGMVSVVVSMDNLHYPYRIHIEYFDGDEEDFHELLWSKVWSRVKRELNTNEFTLTRED